MQAPTVVNLEVLRRVARYLIGHACTIGSGVCATNLGSVPCCRVHCIRLPANTQKYIMIHMVLWFPHATFHQHYEKSCRPEFGRVRLLHSGERDVTRPCNKMLTDFGFDISKNTKIDRAVLEVRVDASAGRGATVRREAGRIRHIATPTLWAQKFTQDDTVQITKILGISNPADLGSKHFD